VQNESGDKAYVFRSMSYAIQNKKQFRSIARLSDIQTNIPPGIKEEGFIALERIDPKAGEVTFYFKIGSGTISIVVDPLT
jgi:hypothetical protein